MPIHHFQSSDKLYIDGSEAKEREQTVVTTYIARFKQPIRYIQVTKSPSGTTYSLGNGNEMVFIEEGQEPQMTELSWDKQIAGEYVLEIESITKY